MPPSFVLLVLVAVGVPSALRAAFGRPRFQLAATVASGVCVAAAQVAGELIQLQLGVVGDAQVGLALLATLAACALVAIVEGPARRTRPRDRATL